MSEIEAKPKPLRWGIIATGNISIKFAKDLLVDPATRDATDVAHRIGAVGSRSIEGAKAFIHKLETDPGTSTECQSQLEACKTYGSYDEVYNDPDVDVIYIGTPHPMHYANAKRALEAGKPVLCEKPFTMSLSELDGLIKIAKDKNVFLMEGVWTRFLPIMYRVQEIIHSGKLGKVRRLFADFSIDFRPDEHPYSWRMIDPALGGGSLLDMGPYPAVWATMLLHHHPDNTSKKPPTLVFSHQTIYARSGVDANTRWLLEWEDVGQALCVTDMTAHGTHHGCVIVTCEKGDLILDGSIARPSTYHIIMRGEDGPSADDVKETFEVPVPAGVGMCYEADEVYRCIKRGEIQSDRMPWEESRMVQGWFDHIRATSGASGTG
ncbi:hypothetical protein CI109_106740 [Kwoniella shandongensis]|uniref:D-xylose 1-dehydrogenase (NADP(+), D-xylono-1,5-lactone-forming) n=1 Tax=Kwoniella shandongensis TaxID=1734106 RepID=A0A5M6C6S4_9TREE|nr:uncharacterized protein CI109_001004 [Kwoniella shandongensis]KAA5530824.1 hypothetical protein CI109_001004 [Kwoniella shandongensis]